MITYLKFLNVYNVQYNLNTSKLSIFCQCWQKNATMWPTFCKTCSMLVTFQENNKQPEAAKNTKENLSPTERVTENGMLEDTLWQE